MKLFRSATCWAWATSAAPTFPSGDLLSRDSRILAFAPKLNPAIRMHVSSAVRDGNWWQAQSTTLKGGYLIGILAGIGIGADDVAGEATIRLMSGGYKCKNQEECANAVVDFGSKLVDDEGKVRNRYSEITVGQIMNGIDAMEADYRNQRIIIADIVIVVVESIHGSSDASIQKRLEYFRSHARQP